jgi:hypothetical protein
MLVLGTYLAT